MLLVEAIEEVQHKTLRILFKSEKPKDSMSGVLKLALHTHTIG
jgi:hypothetical protein